METVVVIAGPTAAGKSEVALRLAQELGGEVISADSVQVYKGMDIGTAKLLPDERMGVPHHMIDVVLPDADFSVAHYQASALRAIQSVHEKGRLPVLVGGSGLYVSSITYDLDFGNRLGPSRSLRNELMSVTTEELYERLAAKDLEAARRIHPNNRPRIVRALEVASMEPSAKPYDFQRVSNRYHFLMIGLDMERPELYRRINRRVLDMVDRGLADEVGHLAERYVGARILKQAIGYKEILPYLAGDCSLQDAAERIQVNTRHFAKRQLTWFRRDSRYVWYAPEQTDRILRKVASALEGTADWCREQREENV